MEKSLNRIENYVHEMRYKNIDNILITKNGQEVYLKNFNKEFCGKTSEDKSPPSRFILIWLLFSKLFVCKYP